MARTIDYANRQPAPPAGWWRSRGLFLAAGTLLILPVIIHFAQERWVAVATLLLTDGLIVTGGVLSAWLLGAPVLALLTRPGSQLQSSSEAAKPTDSSAGAFRFSTSAALGMGAMSLLALLLGLPGLLNRYTVLAILLIGPALHLRRAIASARTKPQIPVAPWLAAPLGGPWLLLLAAPLVGLMITSASILPGVLWTPDDPHPYDAMEYHLQGPREWFEAGRIVELPHNVYTYFPFGVEMHYLMAMHLRGGPWAAMYQCQFFSIAWTLLTAAAVYGAVRGASPRAGPSAFLAPAAAVLSIATPWMTMLAAVAYTETALALYAVLTVAWALRAARSDGAGRTRAMLVAAIAAGLACGTKYTAFPMVVGATLVGVSLFALISRQITKWLVPASVFVAGALIIASPWLIRNAIWTGNPVFPLAMKQLGAGHYSPGQVERFNVAHAPNPAIQPLPARLAHLVRDVLWNWQFGWFFWPTAFAAIVLSLRQREAWIIAGFVIAVFLTWFFATHLLARFLVLCAPVAVLAVGLIRHREWPFIAILPAAVLAFVSTKLVADKLTAYPEKARLELFALEDPRLLMPDDVRLELESPGHNFTLVGDAKAFLYRTPPGSKLSYRTVFDLPTDAKDVYEAWIHPLRFKDAPTIIVHPPEIERLHHTYRNVPNLPPDFPAPRDRPSVLRR